MDTRTTGIVRQVDPLGRVVLPKELRDNFGINVADGVEIFFDDKTIVLKKYTPACIFCNGADHILYFRNKGICKGCLDEATR